MPGSELNPSAYAETSKPKLVTIAVRMAGATLLPSRDWMAIHADDESVSAAAEEGRQKICALLKNP